MKAISNAVARLILSSVLWYSPVKAAQLSLTDFTCASGYPVEVLSFLFQCDGSTCTFGDTANFTGWFHYSNLTSDVAHISGQVSAGSYSYTLFDEDIDLCSNSTAIDGGNCPEDDGEYIVEFQHNIPTAGTYDWFFTGFSLKTHILIYDDNQTDVLGDCYAVLKTQTTSQTTVATTTMRTPSAGFALILFGASIATFLLINLLTRRNNLEDDKNAKLIPLAGPDEIERARSAFADSVDSDNRGRLA